MRVFYELNTEDVKKILGDKYGVNPEKVVFRNTLDVTVNIDMSATETPGENPVSVPDLNKGIGIKERLNWTEGMTDHDISDGTLRELYEENIRVSDLCQWLGLDRRAKDRLYCRVRKMKPGLEGASS